MTHKITHDGAAAVNTATRWIPVGPTTPRGVKLQLISKPQGIAMYGLWQPEDRHFTHWFPLPTFSKD